MSSDPENNEKLPPLIPPLETPQAPPQHKGDEGENVDALVVLERILVPGVAGMAASALLGIGIPSALDSLTEQQTLGKMAQQVAKRIQGAFDAIANGDFSGDFPLMLLFGFLLGIFLRHAYGSERIR